MWCNSQTLEVRLKRSNRRSVQHTIIDQAQKLVQNLISFYWTHTTTNHINKSQISTMIRESPIKFSTQMALQSNTVKISHSIPTLTLRITYRWWIFHICHRLLMLEVQMIQHRQDCLLKDSMLKNYLQW